MGMALRLGALKYKEHIVITTVQNGDLVRIHYTGTLDDGSVFDSSEGRDPLEFEVGSGMVIAGMDAGVLGMTVGQKKTLNIPSSEAYGPINPAARQEVPRDQLPAEIPAEVGTPIQVQTQDGQTMVVQISDVSDETITLDANHPLAGFDLTFEVELVAIGVEPSSEG